MNVAAEAREAALPIEMKKHAYRQTQDGIVISFVVHPNDVSPELAAAPLGTRYVAALVEVSGDETPVPKEEQASRGKKPAHDKKRWEDLDYVTQAGIRCNEPGFETYMEQSYPDYGPNTVERVRTRCGVHSRKDILEGSKAGAVWRQLDNEYQSWLRGGA